MKCLTKNGVAICAAINVSEEPVSLDLEPYSGRGMDGEQCVGVKLTRLSDLFYLGRCLSQLPDLPAPKTDQFGLIYIAYWPACKVKT